MWINPQVRLSPRKDLYSICFTNLFVSKERVFSEEYSFSWELNDGWLVYCLVLPVQVLKESPCLTCSSSGWQSCLRRTKTVVCLSKSFLVSDNISRSHGRLCLSFSFSRHIFSESLDSCRNCLRVRCYQMILLIWSIVRNEERMQTSWGTSLVNHSLELK